MYISACSLADNNSHDSNATPTAIPMFLRSSKTIEQVKMLAVTIVANVVIPRCCRIHGHYTCIMFISDYLPSRKQLAAISKMSSENVLSGAYICDETKTKPKQNQKTPKQLQTILKQF